MVSSRRCLVDDHFDGSSVGNHAAPNTRLARMGLGSVRNCHWLRVPYFGSLSHSLGHSVAGDGPGHGSDNNAAGVCGWSSVGNVLLSDNTAIIDGFLLGVAKC